jgi:hypothetical protein
VVSTCRRRPRVKRIRGGGASGIWGGGSIPCSHSAQSGLRVYPATGLGARLGLGGVAVAVWLRRHRQRVRRSSRMRNTLVTTERTRSDCLMSPFNHLIGGLILPHLESRWISRTIAIHGVEHDACKIPDREGPQQTFDARKLAMDVFYTPMACRISLPSPKTDKHVLSCESIGCECRLA